MQTKVDVIDSEGKFNIRTFIKTNWIAIAIGLAWIIESGYSYINAIGGVH